MTDIEQLIEMAQKLCKNLERAANEERRFCIDLQIRFEQMSWEAFRFENELREIKGYI